MSKEKKSELEAVKEQLAEAEKEIYRLRELSQTYWNIIRKFANH